MDLQTQSTTIRKILHDTDRDRLIIVSAAGVDVYRRSDWKRLAWATLANVTTGAINNSGIWLGTSDAGIYILPHSSLDAATPDLFLAYSTATAVALPSNAITGLDGVGDTMAVAHDAGVSFFPSRAWAYNCSITGGADAVALTTATIAYADGEQIYVGDVLLADWATTDHTNITGAGAVAGLALRDSVLFIAGADGFFTYSGSTVEDTGIDPGNASPTAIWPTSGATASAGYLAFATSDGSNGGVIGVYNLGYAGVTLPLVSGDVGAVWLAEPGDAWAWDDNYTAAGPLVTSEEGDTAAVWVDNTLSAAIHDASVESYHQVAQLSPQANSNQVRRDWTLYAEITDRLGGIQAGTVALSINGVSQAPTTAAITNGYAVTFAPSSGSGYGERVTIKISGLAADGNTVNKTWAFTTASAPALTVTDASPPNVVCIRDISLAAAESDETVDGVNVVWIDTITSPLIVTEAQAKEVGRVAIDGQTYHRHKVGVKVLDLDSGDLQTRDLRQGSIVTITCAALGMTAQKCEILAAQRVIDGGEEDISYSLQAAYYEQVW